MKTRLIDRLRCDLGQECKCTEPEEAWICRHSRVISRSILASELRPVCARKEYRTERGCA